MSESGILGHAYGQEASRHREVARATDEERLRLKLFKIGARRHGLGPTSGSRFAPMDSAHPSAAAFARKSHAQITGVGPPEPLPITFPTPRLKGPLCPRTNQALGAARRHRLRSLLSKNPPGQPCASCSRPRRRLATNLVPPHPRPLRTIRLVNCVRNAATLGWTPDPSWPSGAAYPSRPSRPHRRGTCRGSRGRSPPPAPLYPQGVEIRARARQRDHAGWNE